ncbi:MAG: ornithine cyclodeaminase family protein [Halanaeroarchaeum sp.]
MTDVLYLTSDDLTGLATPREYVDAVWDAYRQRGEGAQAEPRTKLVNEEPAGLLNTYVAVLPQTGVMGGYMYTAGFGERDAWFVTPLFDAATGELLAILDGASMNPFKTGATGAVGVDALAREDASRVGIVGSGAQARGQVRATAAVRDIDHVAVFSPTRSSREAFADEMAERLDATVEAVPDSESAVAGADVVITATNAEEPVFDGSNLDDGAHVTAMGQYDPAKRELDVETIRRSVYVPDLRERAFQDAGSFLHARDTGAVSDDHVHAELGEVVAGKAPGRTDPDQVTVFDSGGTAIETAAAGHLLYEKAIAEGLGRTIEFAPASEALTGR